jgi:hypothetical protein
LRTCLASWKAVRHLGHVELVLADNGPLMVLRHTAPLSLLTGKNWNAFRIPTVWRFFWRPKRDT